MVNKKTDVSRYNKTSSLDFDQQCNTFNTQMKEVECYLILLITKVSIFVIL